MSKLIIFVIITILILIIIATIVFIYYKSRVRNLTPTSPMIQNSMPSPIITGVPTAPPAPMPPTLSVARTMTASDASTPAPNAQISIPLASIGQAVMNAASTNQPLFIPTPFFTEKTNPTYPSGLTDGEIVTCVQQGGAGTFMLKYGGLWEIAKGSIAKFNAQNPTIIDCGVLATIPDAGAVS